MKQVTRYQSLDGELHETEAEAEAAEEQSAWPRRAVVYLHNDKESNWDTGEELGLSEEAIQARFRGALYEVTFELDVNEDGTYVIVSVTDGKTVLRASSALDLLEALKDVVEDVTVEEHAPHDWSEHVVIRNAREVIARAEEES